MIISLKVPNRILDPQQPASDVTERLDLSFLKKPYLYLHFIRTKTLKVKIREMKIKKYFITSSIYPLLSDVCSEKEYPQ